MTNKDTIEWLMVVKDKFIPKDDDWYDEKYREAIDKAIKALEQEPKETWSIKDVATTFERHGLMTEQESCEDAISREAVLSLPRLITDLDISTKTLTESVDIKMIEHLPSVTPKPKTEWIPISERMPEDRDWYLGVFKEPDTGWINPLPFICDYVGSKTKATTKEYWILRGFTDRDEHIDYYFNLECVAWMPLPKPHKAESEDKQ